MRKTLGGGAELADSEVLAPLYTVVCISHLLVLEDGLSLWEDAPHGGWEVVCCL